MMPVMYYISALSQYTILHFEEYNTIPGLVNLQIYIPLDAIPPTWYMHASYTG